MTQEKLYTILDTLVLECGAKYIAFNKDFGLSAFIPEYKKAQTKYNYLYKSKCKFEERGYDWFFEKDHISISFDGLSYYIRGELRSFNIYTCLKELKFINWV